MANQQTWLLCVTQVKTLYVREMFFGAYMIVCAMIGLRRNSHWGFSVYLLLQVSIDVRVWLPLPDPLLPASLQE